MRRYKEGMSWTSSVPKALKRVMKLTYDPYQPTSLIAWNSSVIRGIAVEMIVLSRAMQKTVLVSAECIRLMDVADLLERHNAMVIKTSCVDFG